MATQVAGEALGTAIRPPNPAAGGKILPPHGAQGAGRPCPPAESPRMARRLLIHLYLCELRQNFVAVN